MINQNLVLKQFQKTSTTHNGIPFILYAIQRIYSTTASDQIIHPLLVSLGCWARMQCHIFAILNPLPHCWQRSVYSLRPHKLQWFCIWDLTAVTLDFRCRYILLTEPGISCGVLCYWCLQGPLGCDFSRAIRSWHEMACVLQVLSPLTTTINHEVHKKFWTHKFASY